MRDVVRPPSSSAVSLVNELVTRADRIQKSIEYRQEAALLARDARNENDQEKMLSLLQRAMSWIRLAENEELLASEFN